MKLLNIIFGLLILIFLPMTVNAQQQVLLDKPVRAGELILFPSIGNESNYYYLADNPALAVHPDGNPQFSFLRYVKNENTAEDSNTSISESTVGGGILHALVELKVTDEQIQEARNALRRVDGDGEIIGPVAFKSGTIALISSVAQPNGEFTKQVVGLGSAPILENQKAAVSVQLNKLGSKILWETFNTPTPDFSIRFEMEVEGYLSPKRVKIEADFERMYKNETFEAALATPVLAAEIKASMEELFDSGAIKVTQIGDDDELNKLKATAYNQLINLMFDKVGGTGIPQLSQLMPNNKKSMLDRATSMLDKARKEARNENKRIDGIEKKHAEHETKKRSEAKNRANKVRKEAGLALLNFPKEKEKSKADGDKKKKEETKKELPKRQAMPSLAVAVSYQLKKVKRSGTYKVDLNKYTQTTRSLPFAYNPGNVRKACEDCFREVNMDDPLMKQREINASLGGIVSDDFKHINFVNVLMLKEHQNGQETIDEIKIDKTQFNTTGNFFKMLYGWKGDDDREDWLDYKYKTMWSFTGGYTVESDWTPTKFGSIALEPPVVKKPIYIEVDEDFIVDEEVRAVEIKIKTQLSDKTETQSVNLKTNKEELSKTVEVLLPRDVEDYDYTITYFIKGKEPLKSSQLTSNYGRIDIDRFIE